MQPDITNPVDRIDLTNRMIGRYDAPDTRPFAPLVTPGQDACVFSAYDHWMQGKTPVLGPGNGGCCG